MDDPNQIEVPPSLQAWVRERGIDAYQVFGTADLGLVAFETAGRDGMVVTENVIFEIVRPGTGEPVPEGDVGEIVKDVVRSSAFKQFMRTAASEIARGMFKTARR